MGNHDRRNSMKMRRRKAQTKKKLRAHKVKAAAQKPVETKASKKKA